MSTVVDVPTSDADLWSDAALLDPFEIWRELRDLGPVVWLQRHGVYVLARYDDVKAACADWQVFSSARGVALNDDMNAAIAGGTLGSDPPRHDVLRKVIRAPLTPQALRDVERRLVEEADALVERLVAQGSFDVATELAQHLPVTIVSEAVGLPEAGRERMLEWAAANFNSLAPMDVERTRLAFPIVQEMVEYAFNECVPGKLSPDGWAQRIWDAAERGEIEHEVCGALMNDYLGPSLDTTIYATTSAVWLLAQHPEQWDRVREDPRLVPHAVNEALRLESPIPCFSRYVTRDYEVGGSVLPADSRVIVLWGSANRDERHFDDPETFDVGRRPNNHLGFGFGEHACAGSALARMELKAILTALATRVERIELGEMRRALNNMLRGIERLDVTVH